MSPAAGTAATRIAGDIQETAFRQRDKIVAREIFLRPGLAEAGYRSHNDPGIDRCQTLVPEPFRLQFARLKTLQHHVRSLHHPSELGAVRFTVEVEDLTRFARIEVRKSCAELFTISRSCERRHLPHRVAAGRLDLDHFHAEIGEHAAAQLAAQSRSNPTPDNL